MKKPKTKADLNNDPRINGVKATFSKEAPWVALTKHPYLFFSECRSAIGTIKGICEDMEFCEKCPEAWYE